MLGALLRVGEQFGGERGVLLVGRAARPRAGDRADGHLAGLRFDHHLRRRADQPQPAQLQIEHVRRGIDHAQRAIDVERLRAACARTAAGSSTTWKISPARMYSLHFSTARQNSACRCRSGEIAPERQRDLAARRDVVAELHHRRAQPVHRLVNPRHRLLVCLARVVSVHARRADHQHGLLQMVEDHHQVVEREEEIGQAERVRRRVRQALDVADRVVRRVADGAAAESRQPGHADGAEREHLFLKLGQRVLGPELPRRRPARLDLHFAAARAEDHERVGAEEAVPRQFLAARRALEEERELAARELLIRAHRSQRVRRAACGRPGTTLPCFDRAMNSSRSGL